MNPAVQALLDECRRQEENCTYTALSFAIWLRRLRWIQAVCLTLPVVFGAIATWKVATQETPGWAALCTLLATVLPVAYRASGLDKKIVQFTKAAGVFTNLRDRFRQVATISIHKDLATLEKDAAKLFDRLDKAREPMLTPPDWCFKKAQKKIKAGHYSHDYDEEKGIS